MATADEPSAPGNSVGAGAGIVTVIEAASSAAPANFVGAGVAMWMVIGVAVCSAAGTAGTVTVVPPSPHGAVNAPAAIELVATPSSALAAAAVNARAAVLALAAASSSPAAAAAIVIGAA